MWLYRTPFAVKDQTILDADGNEVRLWGVNYYMPFNHNYINVKEKGIDHCAAIDRDIRDFKRLGIQLVRMHLFDREITDFEGNLVNNEHLQLLDYLLEQLYRNEIYVMITAIAWWNTVENQSVLNERYAFWDMGQSPAFGFSNFYPKHALLWHQGALAAQERYLHNLFTHKNHLTDKQMPEYDHIVAVEVINEPAYPTLADIERISNIKADSQKSPLGMNEVMLLNAYDQFLQEKKLAKSDDSIQAFTASCLNKYLERMFGLVDQYFAKRVVRTHIYYGYKTSAIRDVLKRTKSIDCISLAFYGGEWNGRHTDPASIIPRHAVRVYKDYFDNNIHELGKALICYEWAINCTTTAFDMAVMAQVMNCLGVQMSAYFTYTPYDVAEYNPGWLMQYFNLYHTPKRAAAFCAGGEIFRRSPRHHELPGGDDVWELDNYVIDAKKDSVVYQNEELYIHAGSASMPVIGSPKRIIGSGSSPYAEHEGNGLYSLEILNEKEIELLVLPDQLYVNDPFHGYYYGFANRYCNINKEPVVSRLKEAGSDFYLKSYKYTVRAVFRKETDRLIPVPFSAEGCFRADPGTYLIKLE